MITLNWICLQIGARENYAIRRALQRHDLLQHLLTDSWVPPGSGIARFVPSQGLTGRFHPDLRFASVRAPWLGTLPFELCSRLAGSPAGWPRTIARNTWFQRWAARQLDHNQHPALNVFSYSYARSIFRLARQLGRHCVLGQIDPGPDEERLVIAEHRRYPHLACSWQPAPAQYWQHWSEELELADRIVVNSPWSQSCLLRLIPSCTSLGSRTLLHRQRPIAPFSCSFSAPSACARASLVCWSPRVCWRASPCSSRFPAPAN